MTPSNRARLFASCAVVGTLLIESGLFTGSTAAYVNGPPPATTGGFGEDNCRMCHFDYALNDGSGSLRLEGIPEKYTPGERYVITIRLAHPQMQRGGFQMASRFATGERRAQQAGSFELLDAGLDAGNDARVATINKEGTIQYVLQTFAGSSPEAKGSIHWSVRWQAPREAAGPIVFHTAANAANYDDSPLGDFPYFLETTVQPDR